MHLADFIRNVPDFPKKGIIFKDITTLLKHPEAFQATAQALFEQVRHLPITKVVGIESRGFIFGAVLAEKLRAGFVPIRKPNKLPAAVYSQSYTLEYGQDAIQMHQDAIQPGDYVLLHDDLLATGGTAKAACQLIEQAGGKVVLISFVIELVFLNGRKELTDYPVQSLITYS
ncbi:MAG: adenine phosphoribosyltransferase [Microscillaceae bacterium]|nr:adenine phosphoribosyltransferase [Microscillaceae bacterium]MDW8460204.1 adenine phosphoribosyltransferase [Cytophagales bacterium]